MTLRCIKLCLKGCFVCVSVCVCVMRARERGREGAGYVHDTNKEKKSRKSNAKSPLEESENHK